jgi:methyl-coenzyme M reductase gamma subunit
LLKLASILLQDDVNYTPTEADAIYTTSYKKCADTIAAKKRMQQFVAGTSNVAANRRNVLDPSKMLDKVRDLSDDDVVAILGHRTPGAAYQAIHPPLSEIGEPEDPMRELVKPTDGAAAGDRIRYIQFTDSMYFAPMVPYVRSWMASTRFRGVDPGTLSGRQIIEARERDLDKVAKMLLESEGFDVARSSVRGCTVHGHSLRLDKNGMMFDMLARSVMNPDGSVSIVKDQVGRPLDKAVPLGKPMPDAELKKRTTTYRVDGDAARADKELITYIQRIHTLRTMWGFKPPAGAKPLVPARMLDIDTPADRAQLGIDLQADLERKVGDYAKQIEEAERVLRANKLIDEGEATAAK